MNFQIYQSDVLGKMQRFQSHINKQVDLYTIYNTEAYYKIHVWCVDPDYRDKGQYIISKLTCVLIFNKIIGLKSIIIGLRNNEMICTFR